MRNRISKGLKLISSILVILITLFSLTGCEGYHGREIFNQNNIKIYYSDFTQSSNSYEPKLYIKINNKNICRIDHIKIDLKIELTNGGTTTYTIDEDVSVDGFFKYKTTKIISHKDVQAPISSVNVNEVVLSRASFMEAYTGYLIITVVALVFIFLLAIFSYKQSLRRLKLSFKKNYVIQWIILVAVVALAFTKYSGLCLPLSCIYFIDSILIMIFSKKAIPEIDNIIQIKMRRDKEASNAYQATFNMTPADYSNKEDSKEIIEAPVVVKKGPEVVAVSISNNVHTGVISCKSEEMSGALALNKFMIDYRRLTLGANRMVADGMMLYITEARNIKKLYRLEIRSGELLTIRLDMKEILGFSLFERNCLLEAMEEQVRLSRVTLIIISNLDNYYSEDVIDSEAAEVLNRILMLQLEINANDDKRLQTVSYIALK